jgi:tetratricopeptide (TPR) repeat protein
MLYKTIIILSLILLIPGRGLFSQLYYLETKFDTDSLEQVLITARGPERVRALCRLAFELRINEFDKSVELAEEAYRISRDINDPELDLLATYTIGLAYHHSGDYPKSIRYSLIAKELAVTMQDINAIYQVAHCIVLSYLYSNNPDLAIRYTVETVNAMKSWTHPAQEFEKSIRVGWINMMAGYYREAVPHFLAAETFAEATPMVVPLKIALNQTHLVNCFLRTGDYDSARLYIDRNENFCREKNVDFSDFGLEYKGEYYYLVQKYDSAVACYDEMVTRSDEKGNMLDQARSLLRLGLTYRTMGMKEKAISELNSTISIANQFTESKSYFIDRRKVHETWYTPEQIVPHYIERVGLRLQLEGHRNLYEIYNEYGNAQMALLHLEAYNTAEGKLRELDKRKDVIEINTRYETERKEQQILLLTSENELNSLKLAHSRYYLIALGGFILLVILLTVLLIRHNRMKGMQDKTILEQKLLRAQMNPHFLFNTLTNIQSYMLENDPNRASKYLSRFARLMRNIIDNTARESVPLEQEISTIENYLELQMIRYKDKFEYIIETDELIDPESTFIPPMLAQPIIENAIEHGIKHRSEKGMITIRFSLKSNFIHLEVTDNGVGREQSARFEQGKKGNHRPMATSITKKRLKVLGRKVNRRLRRHIRMDIIDLHDEAGMPCGTKVEIIIPQELR